MIFEIKNLHYSISGKLILKKINLKVGDSKHLLIQGPSGCGKTTLLNLMSGLLKPDSGDIDVLILHPDGLTVHTQDYELHKSSKTIFDDYN